MPDSTENRLARLEEKINKVLDKFKKIEDLVHNQQILYDEFKNFKKDYGTFQSKFEKTKEEVNELNKKIGFLEAENLSLKNGIKEIRTSMEDFIIDAKTHEIEIAGIKPLVGENVKQLIKQIGNTVGENIDDSDLRIVERIQNKQGIKGNIHICFHSKIKKNDFFWKVKKARLRCENIGIQGVTGLIFVNECLSSYKKKLLYETKIFKKDNNYKYVWIKNGKVLIRKDDKEPAIIITCREDLETLKK